jgi:hypothetical protein
MLDLTGWPKCLRLIVRKERAHRSAQLRVTDIDGHRLTAFATNTPRGQLADLGTVRGSDHVAGVRYFSHMIAPRRCRPAT